MNALEAAITACKEGLVDAGVSQAVQQLLMNYEQYQQQDIRNFQFTHADIKSKIEELTCHKQLTINPIGQSWLGRDIFHIKLGAGPKVLLFWSQMHGDESTATAALFDLIHCLLMPEHADAVQQWLSQVTMHFIPLLNPDGCDRFVRRNGQDIDINRDARAQQTPEGKLLMQWVKSLRPDYAFNLHDQNRRHGIASSKKPATISILAPAYDQYKSLSPTRERAMQLLGRCVPLLRTFLPNQIGKYDDSFEPSSFGDTIQGMGISTILIESGGQFNDPERQVARFANVAMYLTMIDAIANQQASGTDMRNYTGVPLHQEMMYDLIIHNLTVVEGEKQFQTDLGIQFTNKRLGRADATSQALVENIGDLVDYGGYQKIDATGMSLQLAEQVPLRLGVQASFLLQGNAQCIQIDNGRRVDVP